MMIEFFEAMIQFNDWQSAHERFPNGMRIVTFTDPGQIIEAP